LTGRDNLAKPLDTRHGKVEFVTLIGATDAELRSVYESETSKLEVRRLLQELANQITDYDRQSLV
ncbi:suppressor of fused domain protein, partial [Streptococcus salivarius]|uniref:suppressor of fused domain protein n=1 Tax=Streptococcus salivarius TaxID=1304 RepID=UPI001D067D61